MKKIGIMTFHRADNLGAVLQAYALQTALSEYCNAEIEIIDYQCSGVEDDKKNGNGLKGLMLQTYYFWKHSRMEKFRKEYLILSERCGAETIAKVSEKYDAFVTGSDQVWNYECSGWDDAYFLDFVPSNKEKYSYAASIGNYRFDNAEIQHVHQLLQDFSGLSVREWSACDVLETIGMKEIVQCPDPVVLLTMDRWKKIMATKRCRQRYIFVYMIQQDVNLMRSARAYAEIHQCKIISNKKSPEFILHCGPRDFLSWIYHAECVFTNSFHGTTFALLFNRPLAADIQLVDGGINCRVHEMLKCVDALDCVISDHHKLGCIPNSLDALEQLRMDAFVYLASISGDF